MKSLKILALVVLSGTSALAQERPPLRPLGPVQATSPETFGPSINLRHTGDGVLVNDPRNRRVLLLDAQMNVKKVVADSTPATATAYSGRMGGLIPYYGDSTLFVDPASMSMLLIDPKGDISRVMSVPRSQDAMMLGTPIAGAPGLDARGGLVYRGFPRFEMRRATPAGGGSPNVFQPPQMPDSTPVVRVDLKTRGVDTLSWVKIPQLRMEVTQDSLGRPNITPIMNPLPTIDDWAVLSDGSVAIVRGRDYHIDWIRPDGTQESTGKIPFDWRRLADEDKVAFMDSVKAQRARMLAEAPRDTTAERMTVREGPRRQQGAPAGGADGRRTMVEGGARIMFGGGGGDPAQMMMGNSQLSFVDPQELPDYQPVFFANSVRADADGNLWVRTIPTKAVGAGATYDVINGRGELVDRVQVPANRTIIGFGTGGIVYLAATKDGNTTLERASVR